MRALRLGIAALLIAGSASAQQAAGCNAEQANRADRAIDDLSDWHRVLKAYRSYPGCDDGAIAEGFSDKIALLLADHWNSVGELAALSRKSPDFERFVLKHVDILMSPEQAKRIEEQARGQCPAGAETLCRRLAAKAAAPG